MSKYFDRVADLRNDPFFPCSLPRALWDALFNADLYFDTYAPGTFVVSVAVAQKGGRLRTLNTYLVEGSPDAANALNRAVTEIRPFQLGVR